MNFKALKTLTIATLSLALMASIPACNKKEAEVKTTEQAVKLTADNVDLTQLDRASFNRAALRLNLPLFWSYEAEETRTLSPEKLLVLDYYPSSDSLKLVDQDGQWSQDFLKAYVKMVEAAKDPLMGAEITSDAERLRLQKVAEELDQAAIIVLASDFSEASVETQNFVSAMLKVGKLIDTLYGKQTGYAQHIGSIPASDTLSLSMARRNWGFMPQSPKLKGDKDCRAIAGLDKVGVDVYPADIQEDKDFCNTLSAHKDAEALLSPFTVVVKDGDDLRSVAYNVHYASDMTAVSEALKAAAVAATALGDEAALVAYLEAAATAFITNEWDPADEAWAAMNSLNSKWYLRVAPDETYWEPCSRKAGFHMSFASINPDALAWQEKLKPVQQEMEQRLADIAGKPYVAREVSFQLPDFINIISNSGDDRDAFGGTLGQSLPNWGPVANEGRGRTVVMSNLYTDPDSIRDRKTLASSLFTDNELVLLKDATRPGLLGTIIHEATHNLGPSHEYEVDGKVDDAIFGGGLATMAEELKAQTGALWYLQFLVEKDIITQDLANQSYADAIYWAMGHIARGLTTPEGRIQPYSQLAAIQLGVLMEEGAVVYDPEVVAANGTDMGSFSLNLEKIPAAVDKMMGTIAKIKATGNKEALVELQTKHINSKQIPYDVIKERLLRLPKTSFVYSIGIGAKS